MLLSSLLVFVAACSGSSSLSRKEACMTIAREWQDFFSASGNFADSANAFSLALGVLKLRVDEELQKDLTNTLDLIDKVDSTITTNSALFSLVEPKHLEAEISLKSKCLAEGIKLDP